MRARRDFDHNTTVAFAAGMVAAQAGCTLEDAVEWMKAQGSKSGRTLEEVATAVCERRIQFSC